MKKNEIRNKGNDFMNEFVNEFPCPRLNSFPLLLSILFFLKIMKLIFYPVLHAKARGDIWNDYSFD